MIFNSELYHLNVIILNYTVVQLIMIIKLLYIFLVFPTVVKMMTLNIRNQIVDYMKAMEIISLKLVIIIIRIRMVLQSKNFLAMLLLMLVIMREFVKFIKKIVSTQKLERMIMMEKLLLIKFLLKQQIIVINNQMDIYYNYFF